MGTKMSHDKQEPARELDRLKRRTQEVAKRWIDTPYYQAVDGTARDQWAKIIAPFLEGYQLDFSNTLEIACGHGRMTEILLEQGERVTAVDILQENIEFCKSRFSAVSNLRLAKNDGVTLEMIPDSKTTFVFCFDSMIHFDSDVVRSYLSEISRVLSVGGKAFLHHSNLTRNPGGSFERSVHARNFMSMEMFSHYAQKERLKVLKQVKLDWGLGPKRVPELDGLTLLSK